MPELNSFEFKTIHGESVRIYNMEVMPKALILSAHFVRDAAKAGNLSTCIRYNLWRHSDVDEQPASMPGNFRWQTLDELSAYRMILTCILNDVEREFASREDYAKMIDGEIAGLTGTDETVGPTGKDG